MNPSPSRLLLLLVAGLASYLGASAPLTAQADDEPAFLRKQGAALHKFAAAAFKSGFPSMARPIWLEILADYDKDNADARKALGYIKFNTTWSLRDDFLFPDADTPNPSAAKSVQGKWTSVANSVGTAHKEIAKEFAAAGRTDRVEYHYRRAIRFLPDDPEVRTAIGHKQFRGMSGTDIEETLFNRSRKMDLVLARELKKTYEVKPITDEQPEFLAKAGLSCTGVESENFQIWGDWDPDILTSGARNAERALAFCAEAFGSEQFGEGSVRVRTLVFLRGRAKLRTVIQATPSLVPNARNRQFIIENVASTQLRASSGTVICTGADRAEEVQDGAVRFVTQQFSSLNSDAMREGIGHAVVGRFFGQNLMFSVAQATGTVTKGNRKLLLPDMDTWAELAIESAFDVRGTKAAQLPLLKASKFPTDGRIKAWSFCDYLLRRDPQMLIHLDNCRAERNPGAVNAEFRERAGVDLGKVETEWKDFWTGASPVLAALRNRAPALYMVSKGAKQWIDALNKARKKHKNHAVVNWNSNYSKQCQQHAEFLSANRKERGPLLQHRQRESAQGASKAGDVFAGMALVSTRGSASKVIKDWIDIPGYRDALLNPYLTTVGVYVKGPVAVIDAVRGVEFKGSMLTNAVYPPANSVDAPKKIDADKLGPEVAAELAKRKVRSKTIGYPISVHTWQAGAMPASVEVKITQNDENVDGFVLAGGRNRFSAAPGMAVFYPIKSLKSGVEVRVAFVRTSGKAIAEWSFKPK